jgi:two-component system nitrate/nitrite response regulator NarL
MADIALFTDEPVVAAGFEAVLSSVPEFRIVCVCRTVSELAEAVPRAKADLLLMDLTGNLTFEVLTQLRRDLPECGIVLWVRDILPALAHQAIQLGVRGILRKSLPCELLLKCLRNVHAGELWLDKALTADLLTARMVPLTRREGQLVRLLSQGLKNKEIASVLSISEGTVKVYLSRLFQKVGARDRFELALYGLRNMSNLHGSAAMVEAMPHPVMMTEKPAHTRWLTA